MSIIEGTPEQLATLTRQKTRLVREVQTNDVSVDSGEIISSRDTKTKISSTEPDYIKVYYKTVMAFGGIDNISVEFLMAVSSHISWADNHEPMIFQNTRIVREAICRACKIKVDMYRKYMSRCVKNGLLIKKAGYRGIYEVNPFFIARGKWDSIKELRATFDFIDGKWKKHMRFEVEED